MVVGWSGGGIIALDVALGGLDVVLGWVEVEVMREDGVVWEAACIRLLLLLLGGVVVTNDVNDKTTMTSKC